AERCWGRPRSSEAMRRRCAVGRTPARISRWFKFSTRPGSRSVIGMGASIRAGSRPAMRNRANPADFRRGFRESRQQTPYMETRHGSPGVTLIELCFVLAVVGILVGLAVPGMRKELRDAAIRSAAFELLSGLQQARSRAIVESKPAVVCLSD